MKPYRLPCPCCQPAAFREFKRRVQLGEITLPRWLRRTAVGEALLREQPPAPGTRPLGPEGEGGSP
jgi:hypothetical protein